MNDGWGGLRGGGRGRKGRGVWALDGWIGLGWVDMVHRSGDRYFSYSFFQALELGLSERGRSTCDPSAWVDFL